MVPAAGFVTSWLKQRQLLLPFCSKAVRLQLESSFLYHVHEFVERSSKSQQGAIWRAAALLGLVTRNGQNP
jgi:hypothetical protein